MTSRKCVDVHIAGYLFEGMFIEGNVIFARCIDGLPEDSVFVEMNYQFDTRTFILRFTHPSFDDIPIGERFPERVVRYEFLGPFEFRNA